ncbi:MAG: S41 family peptidase [Bacteroidota bacterium]
MRLNAAFTFACLFTALGLCAQLPENLGFEQAKEDQPVAWRTFGNNGKYVTRLSEDAHTGKYSATIAHEGEDLGFRAWAGNVPVKFGGQKVKLTGWLKTKGITEGFAGLWLRVDPQLAFDNMADREIKGDRDWTFFEIELDFNAEAAKRIVYGGLLSGDGQVWIDDLELTIDGKPLDQAPPQVLAPAAQDTEFDAGSGITFPDLTPELTQDLATLGKVWGFLKYHHPEVAAGNLNWDYELIRALPGFLSAQDRAAFLADWAAGYPAPSECKQCVERPTDAAVNADYRWFKESAMSDELRDYLVQVRDNRERRSNHYYVSTAGMVGNPEFKHENGYDNMPYPDDAFRYLAAVRYWNMIQYFFPYREETDVDWNATLAENIPAFLAAEDEYDYERAATRMIGQIKDTHANLWGGNDAVEARRGSNIPAFRATFVEKELTVVDFYDPEAANDEVQLGDIITHINGNAVTAYVKAEADYFPASNPSARLRDIGETILRSPETLSQLTVRRQGKSMDVTVSLKPRKEQTGYYRWYRRPEGSAYRILDNNIGYLTLANVTDEDYAAAKEAFKDTRGIIIDIRNYPTAFGPFAFGGFLVNKATPFVKFTAMDLNNPGYFNMGQDLNIPADKSTYPGKVVVLVNELSQSQAEYTTMAFRAGERTIVIGSQTAGADGNVSSIPLPGGMRTMISGLGVFYPDGEKTQRIGIVPDIEVKPTQAGIRAGRDELMERAIEEIMKGK